MGWITGNKAKASVVILNWKRKDKLWDYLRSIKEMEFPLYEIIVVDNASPHGSVATEYTDVILIQDEKN